jgi:hypothetical protein
LNGIVNLGMSRNFYTDANGEAVVEHSAVGEADVYVNGSHIGYMETPGSAIFEI